MCIGFSAFWWTDRGICLHPDRSQGSTSGCTLHPATRIRPCKAGSLSVEGLYRHYSSSRTLETDWRAAVFQEEEEVWECVGTLGFKVSGFGRQGESNTEEREEREREKEINKLFFSRGFILNPFVLRVNILQYHYQIYHHSFWGTCACTPNVMAISYIILYISHINIYQEISLKNNNYQPAGGSIKKNHQSRLETMNVYRKMNGTSSINHSIPLNTLKIIN